MNIRAPAAGDEAALAAILADMLAHYGQSASAERMAEAVDLLLHPSRAGPFALVADDGDTFLGIALFGEAFPASALTRSLFLRDVYVAEVARGRGVGRALMQALAAFARTHGHTRLEWRTGRDNLRAKALYAAIGAPVEEVLYYRVEGDDLERLATG